MCLDMEILQLPTHINIVNISFPKELINSISLQHSFSTLLDFEDHVVGLHGLLGYMIHTTSASGCYFAKQIKGGLFSTQCKHLIQCHVCVSLILLLHKTVWSVKLAKKSLQVNERSNLDPNMTKQTE